MVNEVKGLPDTAMTNFAYEARVGYWRIVDLLDSCDLHQWLRRARAHALDRAGLRAPRLRDRLPWLSLRKPTSG